MGIGSTGRLSEKRLAKQLGARLRPNSGALQGAKGDMELPGVLLEAKSTVGRSINLQHAWLSKIAKEARDQGKKPAIAVNFTTEDGRSVPSGSWVMMRLEDWQEMIHEDK